MQQAETRMQRVAWWLRVTESKDPRKHQARSAQKPYPQNKTKHFPNHSIKIAHPAESSPKVFLKSQASQQKVRVHIGRARREESVCSWCVSTPSL